MLDTDSEALALTVAVRLYAWLAPGARLTVVLRLVPVSPVGRVSTTVAPVTASGPALVTVIV